MAVSSIFEGISAIAQIALASAACVGVWIAWRQLSFQSKEKETERRIAIASEILEIVHHVQGRLVRARLPLAYGPLSFEKNPRSFVQNRISGLCEISEKLDRLQVLAEYVDFRFHSPKSHQGTDSLPSEIKDYAFEVMQVVIAFQYLVAKAPEDASTEPISQQATWKEQFDIAISSEVAEDISGHNLRSLSRRIINEMSRLVREGGNTYR